MITDKIKIGSIYKELKALFNGNLFTIPFITPSFNNLGSRFLLKYLRLSNYFSPYRFISNILLIKKKNFKNYFMHKIIY